MRNYVKEAQRWLGIPRPLPDLLAENRAGAVAALVKFLDDPDKYKRKFAGYCLGQIGDPSVADVLEAAHAREAVSGVKAAMGGALQVLRTFPADATDEQRAQAVEDFVTTA